MGQAGGGTPLPCSCPQPISQSPMDFDHPFLLLSETQNQPSKPLASGNPGPPCTLSAPHWPPVPTSCQPLPGGQCETPLSPTLSASSPHLHAGSPGSAPSALRMPVGGGGGARGSACKDKGSLEAGTARRSKAGWQGGRRGSDVPDGEQIALRRAWQGHFPCLLRAGGKLRPQKGKGSRSQQGQARVAEHPPPPAH